MPGVKGGRGNGKAQGDVAMLMFTTHVGSWEALVVWLKGRLSSLDSSFVKGRLRSTANQN
jgi:hypothetical protein